LTQTATIKMTIIINLPLHTLIIFFFSHAAVLVDHDASGGFLVWYGVRTTRDFVSFSTKLPFRGLVSGLLGMQVCCRFSRWWGVQENPFDGRWGGHGWWVHWVGQINEQKENEENGNKENKRVWWFCVNCIRDWWRWCFRHCHAIWKKKPPPKSPQGFKIHEPAPRLRRETNWQRGKRERERERERERRSFSKSEWKGGFEIRYTFGLRTKNQFLTWEYIWKVLE
jgi:hypothetical protein